MRDTAPDGYCRVNKRMALYYFNAGYTIYTLPCNISFGNPWIYPLEISKKLYKESFEVIIRDYQRFNCTCKETGLYPAFFIKMRGV